MERRIIETIELPTEVTEYQLMSMLRKIDLNPVIPEHKKEFMKDTLINKYCMIVLREAVKIDDAQKRPRVD